MSAAVDSPIVTPAAPVAPIELPAPVEVAPAAPSAESAVVAETPLEKSTEATAASASTTDKDTAPPALKRSPFSDLKNRLFAPKSPPTPATHVDEPVKPIEETAAPVVETPKENAAVVEPEVEATAPVTDAVAEEEKAKKVKGPSVVDRVKALFEKKEKAPVVAKSESAEDAVAPAAEATTLPPVLAAPTVVDETPAAVETAPVAAAVDEPVKETETTATETPAAVESAPVDDASAVKFDEATKSEDKPKKEKDLVKLGRRLSARFGAALSPKKEKKDPLATATPVVAAAGVPVITSEAPVLAPIAVEEVKVEEAKAGLTTAAIEEPIAPTPAVEEAKVEDVVAAPVESEAPTVAETSTEVKA